jgi:hypothetical protein
MHKEAGAQSTEHSQNVHGSGDAHAAVIVAQGDVQSLVKAVLNSPGQTVAVQPLPRVELCGLEVGYQADDLVFSPFNLSAQLGGLGGKRKTDLFGLDGTSLDRARLSAALIPFDGAGLVSGRFLRGKNPPRGRVFSVLCSLVSSVDCL